MSGEPEKGCRREAQVENFPGAPGRGFVARLNIGRTRGRVGALTNGRAIFSNKLRVEKGFFS